MACCCAVLLLLRCALVLCLPDCRDDSHQLGVFVLHKGFFQQPGTLKDWQRVIETDVLSFLRNGSFLCAFAPLLKASEEIGCWKQSVSSIQILSWFACQ